MTEPKHKSLKPRTNAILATVWLCAVVLLCSLFSAPRLWFAVAAGCATGLACGALQDRAIRNNAPAFLKAESALDVRRALTSGSMGTWAIRLQWLLALLLGVLGLSGPIQSLLPVVLGGYFAMMFARETVTFRSLVWLQSYEPPRINEDA